MTIATTLSASAASNVGRRELRDADREHYLEGFRRAGMD